ncbi:HAD-IIB family hydrolase [Exiguobacterium sp.]|uniref:HAD-IIB family hydrolase n=1 Tax=Exiguobacterium sp. TaxID=44751 RepID=UPI00263A865D|nr:HAD-IIB family hydrolase [Exiguobacterium sp.]MCC5891685.1 HAD-IIB family hydrolase [Exiguobacterium sp.]
MERFSKEGRTLVCFDFDETYFPHACTAEQLEGVRRLEDFLEQNAHRFSTMWVTGSSFDALTEKTNRASMRYFPHRIASSLGTELYHVSDKGGLELDATFQQLFPSDFVERVGRTIEAMRRHGIELEPQSSVGQNPWMHNYYYHGDDMATLQLIRTLVEEAGIAANVSRCNPLAGDPSGAYDIDFIPRGAGKTAAVDYVCEHFSFRAEEAYAFGDSGNDLEMLKRVGNGYVLGNGTEQAKKGHHRVTEKPYAAGILEVLIREIE